MHPVSWRLGELALYGECVEALERSLSSVESSLTSQGLLALLHALRTITSDDAFRALMQHLPEIRLWTEKITKLKKELYRLPKKL